jgi:glucose-6-phosphate dehydrogenase assembly protein OpcA
MITKDEVKMVTTTKAPAIVSLQAPKDISIDHIESELSKIWDSYRDVGGNGDYPVAIRATTFTFVVYEPEETQQLLATLGFYTGPVDGILGPATVQAIRAAQKAYGLPRSGKATDELILHLREDLARKSLQNQGTSESSSPRNNTLNASSGSGLADAIATANPCRIIALCPTAGEDTGVQAQVSAYCPVNKRGSTTLTCCEYITLRGTESALERVSGLVTELMINDLPRFLWWKATPDSNHALFKRLANSSTSVIIDSSCFGEPETELLNLSALMEQGIPIADLNWQRIAPWLELTAATFDPPERRASVREIDRVTIDYETGNSTQAFMYLGWLASRLQWHPVSYKLEEGDYQIKRVQLVGPDHRRVDVELAAIPVADSGDVIGDLIALRLDSTNEKAACKTVLCSETGGCMRMESHGGAQSGLVQQVTPLFDQQTEQLLSQQLQRGGRDMLYEESLAIVTQILKLKLS